MGSPMEDPEAAWCEGFITGVTEVREIVRKHLTGVRGLIRGGKATFYLDEVLREIENMTGEPDALRSGRSEGEKNG